MKNVLTALGFLASMALTTTVQATPIGPIDSPGGSKFLYLTNGPGPNFVGPVGPISGNSTIDFDAAVFTFEFTTTGAEDLFADINVLTSEYSDDDPVPDFFGVTVDGDAVSVGSPLGLTPGFFSLVEPNGFHVAVIPPEFFTFTPIVGPDGSLFLSGQSGWFTVSIPASDLPAGSHTLVLFLADDEEPLIDTALLVDNIRLKAGELVTPLTDFESDELFGPPGFGGVGGHAFVAGDETFGVPVPEPSTLALAVIGLIAGCGYVRRRKL
ncbi:MAG: PEP-CTERM sorting domain-containing protein [Planctomycetota bacterium]|nr:PEP-CTERM sorting domain-containing protein [Planctomycetota bacterium]